MEHPRLAHRGRPVHSAIFGKTTPSWTGSNRSWAKREYQLYADQVASLRRVTEKAEADADPLTVVAEAIADAHLRQAEDEVSRRARRKRDRVAAALPDRLRDRALVHEPSCRPSGRSRRSTSATPKPRVLIVSYTLTKQTGRVADAMAEAFEARAATSRRG